MKYSLLLITVLVMGCSMIDQSDRVPASNMTDAQNTCNGLLNESLVFKFLGKGAFMLSTYTAILSLRAQNQITFTTNWGDDKVYDSAALINCPNETENYKIRSCDNYLGEMKHAILENLNQFAARPKSDNVEDALLLKDCSFYFLDKMSPRNK
jgi:hypothetical protein